MTNQQIAEFLAQFADLLDIKGASGFRVSAYRRAADTIKRLDQSAAELADAGDLTSIKGIGKGIASSVEEMLQTGGLADLDALRDEVPDTLLTILAIPGVGPKTVGRLYRELGVTNLENLESAIQAGDVRALKGLGARQEARMLEGIAFLRQRTGRVSIGAALPVARTISRLVDESLGARVEIAGSVRRRCETVANIDMIVADVDPHAVLSLLEQECALDSPELDDAGTISGALPGLCSVRIHVIRPESWGSDLARATGSRLHWETLSEISGFPAACESEIDVYRRVGLDWIPPELRENRGELEAAKAGTLPNLIELDDVRGDLHLHSTWSDGRASIEDLARRAIQIGYEFLAIADHSRSLAIANGLDESRLSEQALEIERVDSNFPELKLLKASEVEIRRDGTLDFPDHVLENLDVVVASLHSGRSMTPDELTGRLLSAIENPHVDIIAHPTGRIVEQRPAATYDWERVFEAAIRTRTALEINANPARLDLPEELAREAVEAGVLISINSDAHDLSGLDVMEYGVAIARRGWTPKSAVVNAFTLEQLFGWLRR